MREFLPKFQYGVDSWLILSVAALMGWGLVMVASASVAIGQQIAGSSLYFFERQALFMVLGIGCAAIALSTPPKWLERSAPILFFVSLLLLLIVLVPGVGLRINDSRRWLNCIVFRLQVSEPARLAMLIYLAGYIVRRQVSLQRRFTGLVAAFVPLGVASALILAEPDFGATAMLLGVAFLMLFLGGARMRDVVVLAIVLSASLAALAVAAPYRLQRLMTFVDPWSHADGSGFQLVQSLIAVGRGRWFGVGLGDSVQKLLYLPEMHTDFIFAILSEELGLVGVTMLMLLYAILVWRGFSIGSRAEQLERRFEAYLCYGLSAWIGLEGLVNMAVNMGLLPTKGLTLPFISYGGSSLITDCVAMGLVLRTDLENRAALARHPSVMRRNGADHRGRASSGSRTKGPRRDSAGFPGQVPIRAGIALFTAVRTHGLAKMRPGRSR